MIEKVNFTLNGKPVSITVDSSRILLWVLRTDLGLTGTKFGCGESYCGSCTVLVNRETMRSCQLSVKDISGKEVMTIEGLSQNGDLHPLQKAFMEHDAMQCGYCTPGMILTAYALLSKNPAPSESDIIREMDNNLCRCGAHQRIVQAIQASSKEMKGGH
jgi:aerobic-type carbon monoxide dehydrogenase small subunit (CoxS/CutS family)